jgi:hypothetical protein
MPNGIFAYLGQGRKTIAYKTFRFGLVLRAAMEDGHPEHRDARKHLDYICERSGYRTDHLPKDAERYKKMWDQVYADANPVEDEPTGAEVVASHHAEQEAKFRIRSEQGKLDRTVQEDHTMPVPIPPRNESVSLAGRPELRWAR